MPEWLDNINLYFSNATLYQKIAWGAVVVGLLFVLFGLLFWL